MWEIYTSRLNITNYTFPDICQGKLNITGIIAAVVIYS